MANFNEAYQIGRVNEGGYVNDKNDAGGETYAGVARNFHPEWKGWPIIDAIKKTRALNRGEKINDPALEVCVHDFYKASFWDRILGDQIADQQVANILYDWTLTSGGAIKEVQQALGLQADGKVGPATIGAINKLAGSQAFAQIKEARRNYYTVLGQKPQNQSFLKGWLARVDRFNYQSA